MLAAVSEIAGSDSDADDVLRGVVGLLVDGGAAAWAGIFFVDEGELVLGPQAGTPAPERRTVVPVLYEDTHVADLAADGAGDPELLKGVAALVAIHCLVGWDTGGEPWEG